MEGISEELSGASAAEWSGPVQDLESGPMTEKAAPLALRLAAEAAGTFALVLVGTGSICWDESNGGLGGVGISLAFGAVVTAVILLFGALSGAHVNPAVTLGFAAARRCGWRQVAPYTAAQLVGALLASALVARLFPESAELGATLPRVSFAAAFAVELGMTAALMLVILRASAHPRLGLPAVALAVGSTVAVCAYLGGPLTGASMNPARSFGPAVVSGHLEPLALYLVAPVLGALLAVRACRLVGANACCPTAAPQCARSAEGVR